MGGGVRRGATHLVFGPKAGTASSVECEVVRAAGSIGSRENCGAANSGSCDAGSARGTRSSSATGGGEEHSRGGALRRGGGAVGGAESIGAPRARSHAARGRAGSRGTLRTGRWGVCIRVSVCCAWGRAAASAARAAGGAG